MKKTRTSVNDFTYTDGQKQADYSNLLTFVCQFTNACTILIYILSNSLCIMCLKLKWSSLYIQGPKDTMPFLCTL